MPDLHNAHGETLQAEDPVMLHGRVQGGNKNARMAAGGSERSAATAARRWHFGLQKNLVLNELLVESRSKFRWWARCNCHKKNLGIYRH